MGDLIPLLGDGLLTIDGDFHRQSRRIMLPAFHRERIEAAHAIMTAETRAALDRVSADTPFDLYRFTRELALRIAMRALFGLDPDRARRAGSTPPTSSRRRWASGRATTRTRSCAVPGRRGGGWCARAGAWTR